MDTRKLHGSLVALVTPMCEDLSVDWDALHKLVEWHIAQGTRGIVAVGTTGESATLNVDEHIAVVKKVVEQVEGRVPVIAGTGANSTSEALELTEKAKGVGADACLLVTPYYNKPSQEGLYLHHKYIAERVDIAQLLYNVPGRTAVDMSADTVARLAKIDNIVGIKEATGDISRLQAIKSQVDDQFVLISGDDETALDFMQAGGHGVISVTANVAPAEMAKLCELIQQGKVEEAQIINQQLLPVHKNLFLEANPIPVKWALAEMGLIGHAIRLPLTPLAEQYHQALRDALKAASIEVVSA